jgi:hypothetical protein
MVLDAIQQVYQKIRDPTTNCFYYFDTRTGESTWTKPKILGQQDIPETKFSEPESEGNESEGSDAAPRQETEAADDHIAEGEAGVQEEGTQLSDPANIGSVAPSVSSHNFVNYPQ